MSETLVSDTEAVYAQFVDLFQSSGYFLSYSFFG